MSTSQEALYLREAAGLRRVLGASAPAPEGGEEASEAPAAPHGDAWLTQAVDAVEKVVNATGLDSEWTSALALGLEVPAEQSEAVRQVLQAHGWVDGQFQSPPDRSTLLKALQAVEGVAFLENWVRPLNVATAVAEALLDPLQKEASAGGHEWPGVQLLLRAIVRKKEPEDGPEAMEQLLVKGGFLKKVAQGLWEQAVQLEAEQVELVGPRPAEAQVPWLGKWARKKQPRIEVAETLARTDGGDASQTFWVHWVTKGATPLVTEAKVITNHGFSTDVDGNTFCAKFENGTLIWEVNKEKTGITSEGAAHVAEAPPNRRHLEVWVKWDADAQAGPDSVEPLLPRLICGHRPGQPKEGCTLCKEAAEASAQQGAPEAEEADAVSLEGSWVMFLKGATFRVRADDDDKKKKKNKFYHCTHDGGKVQMRQDGAWSVAEFSNMTIRERASKSGWAITYQQKMDAPPERKALEDDRDVTSRVKARREPAAEIERQAAELKDSQRRVAELEAKIATLKEGDAKKAELDEQLAELQVQEQEAARLLAELEERRTTQNAEYVTQRMKEKLELEKLKAASDATAQEIDRAIKRLKELQKELEVDESARRLEELQAKDWGTPLHGFKEDMLTEDVALLTTTVAPLWNTDIEHAGLLPPGTMLVAAGPVETNQRGFRVVPLKPKREVSETISYGFTVEARYVRLLQDEETVPEGAATPEAPQARYLQLESLLKALEGGDTVLLKGRWLIERANQELPLPRRQELPEDEDAIWEPAELYQRLRTNEVQVVSVSYAWLHPDHPDEKGEQLKTVAHALDLRLNEPLMPLQDVAVFFDWCSLYQKPRRPDQQDSFNRALKDVNLWYAHASVTVLALTQLPKRVATTVTPYKERGWPCFELAVSSILKDSSRLFDLGVDKPDEDKDTWHLLVKRCAIGWRAGRPEWPCGAADDTTVESASARRPPLHPDKFSEEIESKKFTNGADKGFVKWKYKQTFQEVMGQATVLDFSNLRWTKEDAVVLAAALKNTCHMLQTLILDGNPIGEEGMEALAPTLPTCKLLKEFHFTDAFIGDGGAEVLAKVLPKCKKLQYLQLQKTGITSEGAVCIAGVLPECKHLETLNLTDNDVGHALTKTGKIVFHEPTQKEIAQTKPVAVDTAVKAFIDVMKPGLPLRELALLNGGLVEGQKKLLRAAWKAASKKPENLRLIT